MVRIPRLPVEAVRETEALLATAPYNTLDPRIRFALEIASPSLVHSLESSEFPTEAAHQTTRRFVRRMGLRPTPFGAFAGVALGSWGPKTTIGAKDDWNFRTRPDMSWILALVRRLEAVPEVRHALSWLFVSDAIVRGKKIYFGHFATDNPSEQRKKSITTTPLLLAARELSRTHIPYSELFAALLTYTKSKDRNALARYLQTLWEHGAFKTDLLPPPTTTDPLGWIINKVAIVKGISTVAHQLRTLQTLLARCGPNNSNFSRTLKTTKAYARLILDSAACELQVDSRFELLKKDVSHRVRNDVERLADLLLRLSPCPMVLRILTSIEIDLRINSAPTLRFLFLI